MGRALFRFILMGLFFLNTQSVPAKVCIESLQMGIRSLIAAEVENGDINGT